jgi:hypothetical protein
MTGPFGDDDMARWNTLDLPDRALYDLALLEMETTGFAAAMADMDLELLEHAVATFGHRHGDTRTARAICTAWLVVWHDAHPDVDWLVHTHSGPAT